MILLSREALADADRDPENVLELARELARAGEPVRAAERLAEARANAQRAPSLESLTSTEQLIEWSRRANAPASASNASDPGDALGRARAWLRLGRVSDAGKALASLHLAAKTRLDLAAAVAEALMQQPACPDLPLDVGSAPLCALAFRSSARVREARALLDSAWQSGAGRDEEALEVYAALAHVVPWMHETAIEVARPSTLSGPSALRVALLLQKLREIAAVAPQLSGLPLFVEAMQGSPGASEVERENAFDALGARARSLLAGDRSRFTQAAVLATAASLSQRRDVSTLLDAIAAESTASALRVPRAALGVWVAASSGASARLEAARSDLATVMSEGRGASLERARLVLGVSEADALSARSERSYKLLSRVAGQLLNDDIPLDLALRAVIDAAGALGHGHRYEQADKILAGAESAAVPPEQDRARDLLQLIQGYRLVLKARAPQVESWSRLRADFAALAAQAHATAVSIWFEAWAKELAALERDAECQKSKLKVCREATALRRRAADDSDARLGSAAAAVFRRGALPTTSFEAGFRFSVEKGLEPLILFDPAFLAIELPPLAAP